ncbi:MAG: hypothetical protein QOE06_2920 [Thermoleophilaceae bacterium]|nr:hypothetical protein [Thermoleophilaceae bacterium]
MPPPVASLGSSFKSFFDSVDQFFSNLAAVNWGALLLALLAFSGYLVLRSRGLFNALRAAYPDRQIEWRRVWGAYVAAAGFKNVVPAGGANVIQLFLTKNSIEGSTFATVGSGIAVGAIFDAFVCVLVMIFSFTQGVFPKPPDFSKLNAFDLQFFASHIQFTLFLVTFLAVLAIAGFALLSARVKAFWMRVRQGFTILRDRRRYLREVCSWQAAAWACRFGAYWLMLDAFHIGGSFKNALLVQGVQVVSTIVPLTPGGAGVQQALLLSVFSGAASTSAVAAYSVGQQIALAGFALALGFGALVVIFKIRSFKEVIRSGRAQQAAEAAS